MAMEDLMKVLAQTAEQPETQQALSQVVGGLLGGAQQGNQSTAGGSSGNSSQQVGQMLGMLEQVIGGTPGGNNFNQNAAASLSGSDPIMMLLQPVVNQVAAKANINPQIATVVASLVVHYLISNHPASGSGRGGSLDLNSLFGELAGGGVNKATLHNSGMVNDVVKATGLSQDDAVKALDSTFNVLSKHVQGGAGKGGRTALKRP